MQISHVAFEQHSNTNTRFEQLKDGLQHLKKEESRRATGPLAFVKDNITTFMDAEETLTGTSTFRWFHDMTVFHYSYEHLL